MCNKCCDIFSQRYAPLPLFLLPSSPFGYPLPMILKRNKRKRVTKDAPNGFPFVVGVDSRLALTFSPSLSLFLGCGQHLFWATAEKMCKNE